VRQKYSKSPQLRSQKKEKKPMKAIVEEEPTTKKSKNEEKTPSKTSKGEDKLKKKKLKDENESESEKKVREVTQKKAPVELDNDSDTEHTPSPRNIQSFGNSGDNESLSSEAVYPEERVSFAL